MQPHLTPPPPDATLEDVAGQIAATAATAVTLATRHRCDRDDDGLNAAAVLLAAVDRLTAAVISILQATDHARVIADHGITRDTWLRAVAGRTGGDAGMLLAAAERLADMPAVTAWFHTGVLSWGAVRQIVASTRTLTAAQRGWVDATLAAHDGIDELDGDQVAAAVDGLVHRARPDLHRDRDATALQRRWLAIQPRMDGTAAIHGSLDPDTAAAALAAFATAPVGPDLHTDHTDHPDHPGAGDSGDSGDAGDRGAGGGDDGVSDADVVRAARRRANVDLFGDLCRQRLTRHGVTITDATGGDGDADAVDAIDANGDAGGDAAGGDTRDPADSSATTTAAGGSCRACGAAPSAARPAFLVVADLAVLDRDAPVGSGTARVHWATGRAPVELHRRRGATVGAELVKSFV